MVKAQELLDVLTESDVVNIMTELGCSDYVEAKGALIFESVCHGSDSHKLYWYKNSKRFTCF